MLTSKPIRIREPRQRRRVVVPEIASAPERTLTAPETTIPATATEITSLILGVTETVTLGPRATHLFQIALQEDDSLRVWAFAMGELDVYVEDRFGLPVAYGLEYSNPDGNLPEASFKALGTGEYLIKLVSHSDRTLLAALEACASGLSTSC